MEFQDISKNLLMGENMGGIAQIIYYGLHSDVATWPARPTDPLKLEDLGELTGNLVMKPTKKLFSLYITDDTGELENEVVGEKDGISFVQHLRFFHPGLRSVILGFMNAVKNENLVFVVLDNNGQYFILGDETRPATLQGTDDVSGTGKETASRRGVSLHFTYKTSNIYQYTGTIPLTPAV